jgi:hypothetical protein
MITVRLQHFYPLDIFVHLIYFALCSFDRFLHLLYTISQSLSIGFVKKYQFFHKGASVAVPSPFKFGFIGGLQPTFPNLPLWGRGTTEGGG